MCEFLGYVGVALIFYFCVNGGSGGTWLEACWAILGEWYLEY